MSAVDAERKEGNGQNVETQPVTRRFKAPNPKFQAPEKLQFQIPTSRLRTPWKNRGPSSPRRGACFSLSWGRGPGWDRGEGGRFGPQHFHESDKTVRGVRSPE